MSGWDRLGEILEGLAAHLEVAKDTLQVRRFLENLIRENQIQNAVSWSDPVIEKARVKESLEVLGVDFQDRFGDEAGFKRACAQADLGITGVDAIVDETGTLVLRTGPGRDRSVSLLPPIHLALLDGAEKVSTIHDLAGLLSSRKAEDAGSSRLPSSIHLVTGPSRTADIEFAMVLGAHGPRALYVLALDF